MEAVKDYLEDIGVYEKGTIKRSAGDKYSTVAARLCISMETVGTGGFILHAAES